MDRQLIRSLIDALAASDLSELEYSSGGSTLRLVKSAAPRGTAAGGTALPAPPAAPSVREAPAAQATPPAPAMPEPSPLVVTAPLFGIVHLSRSPGDPPLAVPGQAVAAGQVLCLIEAMKVFTQLQSDADGIVEAVLVTGGQEVEAGQPLFRLAPR